MTGLTSGCEEQLFALGIQHILNLQYGQEEILRLVENHMSKKCAFQWGDPMENQWEIIDFIMMNVFNLHRYL